jgi:hypothetical protein
MVKLITVTWSYEPTYDIKSTFLYRSFIKFNDVENFIHIHYNRNDYLSLEFEFKEKYAYQYEYLLYKIFLTRNIIQKIDSDYFIFSDASDVVCLGNIDSLTIQDEILFSSEINQYPSSFGDWGGIDYTPNDHKNKNYLNAGLFLTNKENYIKLLDNVINNILPKNLKSFGGDQGVFIFHYLSNNLPKIILDTNYTIFLSTFSRHRDSIKIEDFPLFVHDNGWDWGSPRFITNYNLI